MSVEFWSFDNMLFQMKFGENFTEEARMVDSEHNFMFMEDMYPYRFSKSQNDSKMLETMLQSTPLSLG